MGSLILVTILLFYGNGEPVRIMKFIYPHSLEMSEIDSAIMKAIKDRKPFAFNGTMAQVEKVNHMISPIKIGEEIKLQEPKEPL